MTRSSPRREAGFVDRAIGLADVEGSGGDLDRIVVIGGSARTLDMLRLATLRSDDVVLVAAAIDPATQRHIDHFAVEHRARDATEADLDGAAAVLVTIGDIGRENQAVRGARRRRVPVHVPDRPLVSDFTILDMLAGPAR